MEERSAPARMMGWFLSHSAMRYGMVGIANTLVGLSAIYVFKLLFGAGDALANLLGYIVGFAFSYVFNSKWTFRYTGSAASGILRFALVTVVAYLCNLATVLVSIHSFGVDPYLAQAAGTVPYAVVGYLGGQFFAFAERSRS